MPIRIEANIEAILAKNGVYSAILALDEFLPIHKLTTVLNARKLIGQQEWMVYADKVRPVIIDDCKLIKSVPMMILSIGDDGDGFYDPITMPVREFCAAVKDA